MLRGIACLQESGNHVFQQQPHQRHEPRQVELGIDEKVGQILQALDEKGYSDNSVVIFTSDHGDCLGDHGHIQKWTMYDIITRVPLMVWAPGRYQGGRDIPCLCQQMDIAPVIMELAGHKHLSTTQRYIDCTDEMKRAAVESL